MNLWSLHGFDDFQKNLATPCAARLSANMILLHVKAKSVGDHGDELAVRWLTLDIADCVAEKLLQSFNGIDCFICRLKHHLFIAMRIC